MFQCCGFQCRAVTSPAAASVPAMLIALQDSAFMPHISRAESAPLKQAVPPRPSDATCGLGGDIALAILPNSCSKHLRRC